MTQIATVCEIKKDSAVVEVRRRSACEGCHAGGCLGCGKTIRAEAHNQVGARVGDTVEIETTSARVLLHAALVFLVPLLVAGGFYLFGWLLSLGEAVCYLLALGGIAVTFGGLVLYVRLRGVQVPLCIIRVLHTEETEEVEEATEGGIEE